MGTAPLAMNPSGMRGRAFGVLMEWLNTPSYRAALKILATRADEHILEIGFGTGKFAELLLSSDATVRMAGVDPSATMVSVANSRRGMRRYKTRADLRRGDASALPWPSAHFHAVVAIHNFQFWPNPHQSLDEISRVIVPSGRILFVLRNHANNRPSEWLPNPLCRSSSEVSDTTAFLQQSGYYVRPHPDTGNSHVLEATRKT